MSTFIYDWTTDPVLIRSYVNGKKTGVTIVIPEEELDEEHLEEIEDYQDSGVDNELLFETPERLRSWLAALNRAVEEHLAKVEASA